MARKKLLTEGEVRQFMKLANIGPLTETYLSHNPLEEEEEEIVDDGFPPAEDEEIVDELPGEEDMGLEAADEGAEGLVMSLLQRVQDWAEENGVEMDLDGDEGGDELDAELEDEEGLGLPDEEMGAMEMGAEEEIPMQEDDLYEAKPAFKHPDDPEDEESEVLPALKGKDKPRRASAGSKAKDRMDKRHGKKSSLGTGGFTEEQVVAEVTRRVAARMKSTKKRAAVADQLAERIFDRLTSKSK